MGAKLHVVVATVKIPKTSPRVLQPGHIYSYDCEIVTAAGPHTLKSLGLLNTGDPGGKRIEALGFEENFLPSFALPPAELTDLRIVYGSCRRPANSHLDAMAQIDDLMRANAEYDFKDPSKRPHQLHLGGDQIYADDVSPVHLYHLIDLGRELIGARTGSGEAIETLRVNQVRGKKVGTPKGFADYDDTNAPGALPADHAYFPAARRFLATTVDAQMTTVDAQSHLFSIGEFAAMYLSVWSNAVWPALERPSPGQPAVMPLATDEQLVTPRWPDRIPTLIDAHARCRRKAPRNRSAGRRITVCQLHAVQEGKRRRRRHRPEAARRPPQAAARLRARPGQGAARARQHPHLHGLRRPRRHRRLEPEPAVARPRAHHAARRHDRPQRPHHLCAVPGLGQRPAEVRKPARRQEQAARPHRRALPARRAGRPRRHRRQRHRRLARPEPAPGGGHRRQLSRNAPAAEVALLDRRPGLRGRRPRQPHPAQLRLAQRPAGQRGVVGTGRPDPTPRRCRTAPRC